MPLARYLPKEAFNSWGWRIPFLLSFVVLVAAGIIRRQVSETPAFATEDRRGEVPRAPIIQAFKDSWKDMLRVVGVALMNVIPVVTTVFGAAYAVQPAYGIGFHKDVYLWIPVLGNIVAVLVIPFVGNLSDKIGRRPPIIVDIAAETVIGKLQRLFVSNPVSVRPERKVPRRKQSFNRSYHFQRNVKKIVF